MKIQIAFFCLVLGTITSAFAMDSSSQQSLSQEKIALLQAISRELGAEKSPTECDALLAETQEIDAIAALIKGNQHRPMQAPWRDAYKKQLTTPVVQLPQQTTPLSQQARINTSLLQQIAHAPRYLYNQLTEKTSSLWHYLPYAKTTPITTQPKERPCPFCDQFSRPEDDHKNYILERHQNSVVMFNRTPYGPLHFLIIPYNHLAKMSDLSPETRQEMIESAQRWIKKLKTLGVDNTQFFFNLEDRCSGASLPGHVHGQLLSRWQGDESAIASRVGSDLVSAERRQEFLGCFYDIAEKKNSEKSDKDNSQSTSQTPAPQALPQQTEYDERLARLTSVYDPSGQTLSAKEKALAKLASIYMPYKKLLASTLQPPCKISPSETCYTCSLNTHDTTDHDHKHLVIKRFAHWILLLNRFGSAGGDSFLITKKHKKSFEDLNQEELTELNHLVVLTQENLRKIVKAPGYNVGCGNGDCAGNPFHGHVCVNIIPRTPLDTAAITTQFGFTIMDKDVDALRERLAATFESDH